MINKADLKIIEDGSLSLNLMKMPGIKMRKNFGKNICGRLVCVLLAFLYPSCSTASPGEVALDNFSISISKEIQREYGFQVLAIGASFPVKINSIDFRFTTNRPATIAEGRKIIVPIALKFIQRMNEDSELMKYLADSPASIKNVSLFLRFEQSDSSPLQSAMVIGTKNLVIYNKNSDDGKQLIDLHRESFDEAVRVLQQESNLN